MTIKNGYQTSEFWGMLITHILAIASLLGFSITLPDTAVQAIAIVASLLASSIASLGYSNSRGRVKAAVAMGVHAPTPLPPPTPLAAA